jgi:hypothetical protein
VSAECHHRGTPRNRIHEESHVERKRHPKSERICISEPNLDWTSSVRKDASPIQDFGFEMQDPSNFTFRIAWAHPRSTLVPRER